MSQFEFNPFTGNFSKSPLNTFLAGGGTAFEFNYLFDDGTVEADPGAGNIRFNNADPSLTTELYISLTDADGVVREALGLITPTDIIKLDDTIDATKTSAFEVILDTVDNVTFITVPVINVSAENPFVDGDALSIGVLLRSEQLDDGVRYQKAGDQPRMVSGAWTLVPFANEIYDDNNYFSGVAGIFNIPRDGTYTLHCTGHFNNANTIGGRGLRFSVPNTVSPVGFVTDFYILANTPNGSGNRIPSQISYTGLFTQDDEISVQSWQNSGNDTAVSFGTQSNSFIESFTITPIKVERVRDVP